MHRLFGLLLFLGGILLTSALPAFAQSITVSPSSPTVAVTKTVAFSAQTSGLSGSDVTWKAGGVLGGNATAGTISATGLYTAPAVIPAQNPVQIKATSKVNTTVSGTVYVYLIAAGPTITAVTPNPIAVGTVKVTITGSTFKVGATAYISYGSNSRIQMTTNTVSANSLTATGYLGPATSATFCVRNPDSDFSNAITVPVQSSSGGDTNGGTTNGGTTNGGGTGGGTTTYALNVVNGSGSGSYAAGTVVTITANPAPSGQTFANWSGAVVTNSNLPTTTLTMPAATTTVTANYVTAAPPTIPYPVTTHPRLWITQNTLPKYRSWATASNPIYQKGIVPLLQQAVSIYNTQFFPNGVANPNYPDPGDVQGYSGYPTEMYAIVLAFNSLIDPDPNARIKYAQYARNMLMVAMNQAALGHQAGAPFRDPMFAVYNRANGSGEQWPLIVDWIYNAQDAQGNPILTASDKLTIRNVFMIWANDCLNAYTTGGDHPAPIGLTNSPQLLPNNRAMRVAANNYYLGHARLLTLMALSIDPNDDPPVDSTLPGAQLGNSLRSYIPDATGAWLYQQYAMFGDAASVAQDYGIGGSGAGLGLASGGLPVEGMLYGHSLSFLLGQLLALQTAGFHNTAYAGPQIKLIDAPIWDRFAVGFMSNLIPAPYNDPTQPWLGPVYQFGSYGDLLRLWVTPDFMQTYALLALLDQENGKTTHLDMARWFVVNAVEGGPNALLTRITQPWSYGSSDALLYFLLLDPSLPPATDPRPSFPTTFFDPGIGRVAAHSDWSATGTMFDYRASWLSINHQLGDGGQFELYRKGEWLTKEMSNYDNNALGMTSPYHNTLALQNWCAAGTPNLQWFEAGEWANGSQWTNGLNAGDPTTISSNGPGYVYASSDLTPIYNRPNLWTPSQAAMDITQATRSIVWLNNDYVVVYDRAASAHTGLFKRFNLSVINNPTIQGNVAVETLNSGQQLFVQTLLPAAPSITAAYTAGNLSPIAQMEPTRYILTVEDPNRPAVTRFLHVLQGADAGTGMVAATYLQSTQGTAFDGAVFGNSAVFFPTQANASVTTTNFLVPSSVHTLLLTGLNPGSGYGLSVQSGSNGTQIVLTPGGTGATADSAGLLKATF